MRFVLFVAGLIMTADKMLVQAQAANDTAANTTCMFSGMDEIHEFSEATCNETAGSTPPNVWSFTEFSKCQGNATVGYKKPFCELKNASDPFSKEIKIEHFTDDQCNVTDTTKNTTVLAEGDCVADPWGRVAYISYVRPEISFLKDVLWILLWICVGMIACTAFIVLC